ncbi:hypothetical protein L2E82_44706 [Cichorium intybus]|uniref:Uncharacterized protein n=1 Tax=Cichorium intybus TaxID=13427 RepID=A0ACB8ZVD7_CICIN|nr:hypothetical protein L2E82_44706 [Cichorium intybus]
MSDNCISLQFNTLTAVGARESSFGIKRAEHGSSSQERKSIVSRKEMIVSREAFQGRKGWAEVWKGSEQGLYVLEDWYLTWVLRYCALFKVVPLRAPVRDRVLSDGVCYVEVVLCCILVDDVKAREKVHRYGALDGDIRRMAEWRDQCRRSKEFLRDYVRCLVGVAVSYVTLVESFMIMVSTREMVSGARSRTGEVLGLRLSVRVLLLRYQCTGKLDPEYTGSFLV